MDDITNYQKKVDCTYITNEISFFSNLPNDFISIQSQLNRIFNLYQESPDFIKTQIMDIRTYQKKLIKIISLNSPFRISITKQKQDRNKKVETVISLDSDTKRSKTRWNKPIEETSYIKYTSNHVCDSAIAKILKATLHFVKENVSTTSSNVDTLFQTIEDSINELSKPNCYQSINYSFVSTIEEIKGFLYSLFPTDKNIKRIIELTLLLYTKLGGLDTFLEWVDLMTDKILEGHFVMRSEILYMALQTILTSNDAMTNEIKSHIEDCLGIDIDDNVEIPLEQAIEIMFIAVLRLCKMEENGGIKSTDCNLNSEKNICSDIFVWEYDKMIDHIKSAYPDSLCTRLKSSTQKPYNKQVDATETELIMVNSLGEVSIRSLVKGNSFDCSIKRFISPNWLPVQFPDINVKIDQICVGFSGHNSSDRQHVLALTKNGQLFSWGGGQYGKLGHGDLEDLKLPKLIVGLRGYLVKQISAGINHSAAVTETGLSFIWGDGLSFNYENDDPCLIPKRLKQGIMSKIICGPQCTFMVGFNQKEITYMGTSCPDLQCYKDKFLLPVHPNLIKWVSINEEQRLCDSKSEKIQKVVVNSTGMLALLTNGQLYSIGYGLILGCPNCQIHQVFDRVKAIKDICVRDVALSESHVVVLAKDVIYSWSISATTLVIIQQSLSHHVTSVSASMLLDDHNQINIAWSSKKEPPSASSTTKDLNPYLYSTSIVLTLKSFKNILSRFAKDRHFITFFERNIQHVLKLLIVCMKNEQFTTVYLENVEVTEGEGLIEALLDIYDLYITNDELNKVVIEAIQLSSKVIYHVLDIRTACILKLLTSVKSLQSLSNGAKILLNTLIKAYDDNGNPEPNFIKLWKLPMEMLNDLLISMCRVLTGDMISHVREYLNSARTDINTNRGEESLDQLLNQCASFGYRIYLDRVHECLPDIHNVVGNLCRVLPMVNSVIDCLKSYVHSIQIKEKLNQWIVSSDAISVNCLFNLHSPMGRILSDILFFLLEGCHNGDVSSLIPHISSTILSLNEINTMLPNTFLCDKQESHFPLYGFPSLSQTSYSLPESSLGWVWLIDIERMAGMLYGNLVMDIVKSVECVDDDLHIIKWINTPLFRHLCHLEQRPKIDDSNLYQHDDDYNRLLNLHLNSDFNKYRLWRRNGILHSCGLQIYITIVGLVITKYSHLDLKNVLNLYSIPHVFNRIIGSMNSTISTILGTDLSRDDCILTVEESSIIGVFANNVQKKCLFLQEIFSEFIKNCRTDYSKKRSIKECHYSRLLESLDLQSYASVTKQHFGLQKSESMEEINVMNSDDNLKENKECLHWFKEIYPSFEDFLKTDHSTSFQDDVKKNLSAVMAKRAKSRRAIATVKSIDKLFDANTSLLDSVFIQIINGMLESTTTLDTLSGEQTLILEAVFRIVVRKLKTCSELDISSAVPRRMCASILTFISQFNFMQSNFINLMMEENVLGLIVSLLHDRPFIFTDNWLIIEGNGDENLRNVCNMIAWCCIEDLLLNLSGMKFNISEMVKVKMGDFIIDLVEDIYQQINDNVYLKIFDLYALLILSIVVYDKSDLFHRKSQQIRWIDLLLRVATITHDDDLLNIFYSKYAIHICANDLLSIIMSDMIDGKDNQFMDELLIKSMKAFAQFYYHLLTEVPKLETKRLIKSIECRFNSFKEMRTNDHHTSISNWTFGNGNFDRTRTQNCDILSTNIISVSQNDFGRFLALTHESLHSGVWQVTIDLFFTDSQIDFACGFLINETDQWPTDYQSLMDLRKVIQQISLSSKGSILNRLQCVIDIDECIVYFINCHSGIQTFIDQEGFFRFFLTCASECRVTRGTFQAQVVSVKRMVQTHIPDINNVLNNAHIGNDNHIVRSKLYETVMKWCDKRPQTIFNAIIGPLTEQLKFCRHLDHYSETKITDPSSSVDAIFALFLLNGISQQHRLYRGELCTYLSPDTEEHHPGVVLNFNVKLKSKLGGLNFVDRIVDSSDIVCTVHSLSTNATLRIPIKYLIKDEIYGESILEKYFRIIFPNKMDDIVGLLMSLLNCISLQFYDNDVSNFDKMPWSSDTSDYGVEYQFMKCLSANLFFQIINNDWFLEYFSVPRADIIEKKFKSIFQIIVKHSIKPSPIKLILDTKDFICCSMRLMEGFQIMRSEMDLGLAKKYKELFLQTTNLSNLGTFITKREKDILIRVLKRNCSEELVDSILNQSNNPLSMAGGGSVTFNIRRRVLDSSITSDYAHPMPNIALPQSEFDINSFEIQENLGVTAHQHYENMLQRQRLIQAFFTAENSKSKVSRVCPICGMVLKSDTASVFAHLSTNHAHNCSKTFQHRATTGIDFDGVCHDLEIKHFHCATVTDTLYCVCEEFLTKKSPVKDSRDDFETFVNEHYETNPLIGWTGTLSSEEYCYQGISDVKIYQPVKRPELEEVSILGDNIFKEINESKSVFNKIATEDKCVTCKPLCNEVPFVCQLNVGAIVRALNRIQFSNVIMSSRDIILKLVKWIYKRKSKIEVCDMARRYMLIDIQFLSDIIRLVECGRFNFEISVPDIVNEIQLVNFGKEDFISTLIVAFEDSLNSPEKIHSFLQTFIYRLENLLTSSNEYFNLSRDADRTILECPSRLLVHILANTSLRIIESRYINYEYWQEDVESIIELCSFGIINNICGVRDKIWCLDHLKKLLLLIMNRKPLTDFNDADMHDDLSTEDAQVVFLTNGRVKKLISTTNRQYILTADCEGTLRIWDIDSKMGLQQHLQHTLLFSLGEVDPSETGESVDSTVTIDDCKGGKGVLKNDVSEYLDKVSVQLIAVSFNGLYVAETIGVYLNIWSTRSVFSQPQLVTLPALATVLHFPESTFNGLCGAPVDQLLIGLANGELILLRIFDNGARITQKTIAARDEENLTITAIAWEKERNPIAIGYGDGVIVLTEELSDSECVYLETIHSRTIHQLLYCPYATKFGKYLLASSSLDEASIAIWNVARIVCVIPISDPVSCIDWLPKKFVSDSDMAMIVVGTSVGTVQMWRFHDTGRLVEAVCSFYGHVSAITILKTCLNTGILISGCASGLVNVWHIQDRSLLSTFTNSGIVVGAEWTPQNNLVVAWSQSQHVFIWQHFNDTAFQKNGLRQWAAMRHVFLAHTGVRTIKHMTNMKLLMVSIDRMINQQFSDEESFVKCGYSIVYSQYLQALVQFVFSLDLLPSMIPCSKSQCLDLSPQLRHTIHRDMTVTNVCQRRTRCHTLNRNHCVSRCNDLALDWLFDVDELIKVTRVICFDDDQDTDLIPIWWWHWCFESDAFAHNFRDVKWHNRYWNWDMQIELNNWFQSAPHEWISNYRSSTYLWGCGKKGELNFVTNKDCERPSEVKMDGIQQVVCGSALTLVINSNGNMFACGEGLEIVFNPYLREESSKMILVPMLSDFAISQVSVSKGPESHIIAITTSGDVYSWGFGSHGKLGHGHGTTLKKPKLIEGLRGKSAVQADCGHMHSAVVTANGKLYTFGLGAYGQLGVEILPGSDTPRLVAFDDDDVKIGYVACGSSHTVALTQDGACLYAFGEGAFGKLGVGDFDNRYSPVRVNLGKYTLLKIECGMDFSLALTDRGDVLSWGHADFVGLREHGDDIGDVVHITSPTLNVLLADEGLSIIDISAGNDVTFAVTTTGVVYGWGSNSNNLLLDATSLHVYLPQVVPVNTKSHFKQISCGRYHASASSYSPHSYRYDIPTGPQLIHNASDRIDRSQYPILAASELSRVDLSARIVLILYWNELIRLTWQFWLPLTVQKCPVSDHHGDVPSPDPHWPLISPLSHLLPESSWTFGTLDNFRTARLRTLMNHGQINNAIYRYISSSMITNRSYGSLVKVSRIGNSESVFAQICHQVLKMYPMELRLPWRAWKVKLINEGADDAGGAYDETISEMCTELQCSDPDLNILIPSPSDNTVYLPNPNPNVCQNYFKFLGILMGTAIRTKKPLDLNLDPLFWKLLTKSTITREDLRRLDPAYFNSLLSLEEVRNCDEKYLKEVLSIDHFVVFSVNRTANEMMYRGTERDVTGHCLSSYVQHAIAFRLHEFDRCIAQIRDGFAGVSPLLFLDVMSWTQLERAVCGAKTIHVSVLKSIARYVDVDENNEIFSWFWDIIDKFSETEKSLFLRFVTGKSRLPCENAKIPFRLFIYLSKQPVDSLPQAQTCFNQIRLPRYTCREDLEYRLKIAISQCRSIDMDDYMLARNHDP